MIEKISHSDSVKKIISFDLDGTLINSMPYHALAWKQVAYEHGFDIDVNDIYAMGGSASRYIAAFYKNKGEPVGDIDEYVKIYSEAWKRGLKTTYYLHVKPRHQSEQTTVSVEKLAETKIKKQGGVRGFGFAKRSS